MKFLNNIYDYFLYTNENRHLCFKKNIFDENSSSLLVLNNSNKKKMAAWLEILYL